jgi:acetyl-CoA carboxylase biotin carboxyl carrier protein
MSAVPLIEHLVRLVQDSQVETIEVKRTWFSTTVRVSKHGLGSPGAQHVVVQAPATAAPVAVDSGAGVEASTAAPGAGAPKLVDIKSPMVGTYYRAPEPGAEPYVSVGAGVRPGQSVCIIEAMKIMNEIQAEVTGVIREILVEDAQPVEFGQVLFRVDPHG